MAGVGNHEPLTVPPSTSIVPILVWLASPLSMNVNEFCFPSRRVVNALLVALLSKLCCNILVWEMDRSFAKIEFCFSPKPAASAEVVASVLSNTSV